MTLGINRENGNKYNAKIKFLNKSPAQSKIDNILVTPLSLLRIDNVKHKIIASSPDELVIDIDFTSIKRSEQNLLQVDFNDQTFKINVSADPTFRRQYHRLVPGWNLISFYIEPDRPQIAKVLHNIKDEVLQVKDERKSYAPSLPGFLNTLPQVETGKGYWLRVSKPVKLYTEGSLLKATQKRMQLRKGWNLIAFPREAPQAVNEALAEILDKTEEIKNASKSFNPKLSKTLNTLKTLQPGEGYWIKVSADCLLEFK